MNCGEENASIAFKLQCNFLRRCGSIQKERTMKLQLIIRRFAGVFVLVSLVLAYYHSRYWLWFTAFVGFNLVQSSFTNFCPLEIVLKKMGIGALGEQHTTDRSCCSK
jgi:hypothetical protein